MSIKTTIAPFTKEQVAIIKGVAILLILFHNFFHWVPPIDSTENEFYFKTEHIYIFLQAFVDSPWEFINILFSYLGHFGVQIFIFISGYGLAKSFQGKEKAWGRFMVDRLKKIYPLLIIGLVVYILSKITMTYQIPTKEEYLSMVYKLLFIHVFIPGETMSLCGPWWFFGFIIQLYIFFPLLYKLIKKHGFKAFVIISTISYFIVYYVYFNIKFEGGVSIMGQCLAHFPEFCLGIYLAEKKHLDTNPWALLLALTVFVSGNFHEAFFPLTFLSMTYIFIYVFIKVTSWNPKPNTMRRIMIYIGNISMFIFVVHGMFRWQFVCLSKNFHSPIITVLFALLFFLEVFLISLSAKVVCDWVQRLLYKTKPER